MSGTKPTLHLTDRASWRRWLERHHATAPEIWLVFTKKRAGVGVLSHDHAIDEALCFGWSEGPMRRIDDDRYIQRFSSRRSGEEWSAADRARILKLVRAGRMTPAGLAAIGDIAVDVDPEK